LPEDFACVRIDGSDGNVSVAVLGEIDLATAGELDRTLASAQADARTVTLDLRRLQFIGSAGLAVLIAAAERAGASGGRFRVVRGSAVVDRLLSLTGFQHRFEMTSRAIPVSPVDEIESTLRTRHELPGDRPPARADRQRA
jgi:anti-sigma B factor antagonist